MNDGTPAPRILIADDDEMIRALLVEALSARGAEVTAVENGEKAACEAMLHPYDVCILDVEMPVSIAFGRSSMQLKEVMKLTTGSAVELDRRADDDVELIVNNCVIARGQVVVVDGNYGVRITEIVSREQRLALRVGGRI